MESIRTEGFRIIDIIDILNDKNSYHHINNSSIPSNNLKMQAQSVSIVLKEFNLGIEALGKYKKAVKRSYRIKKSRG